MIAILWTYRVKPEHSADFAAAYGAEGEWARLFRRHPDYVSTELYSAGDCSWLTIDRWRSEAAFADFLEHHRSDYDALDRATEGWTDEETQLGIWQSSG